MPVSDAASAATLRIEFPADLPVSAQRAEIEAALAAHQVIIVCGETGSGKTTQLPKIALAMGRGRVHAQPGERGQLIGHTQPRRIAASSVARRIAQELNTPLGEVVGYQVRFQERVGPRASVKLMTDGILLAETQTDPLLRAYDTIIIDEAHERSLNIDFLLGYLKQILPRRPDLKLIVTSATIDADRFARHFGTPVDPSTDREAAEEIPGEVIPAPVLMVSGRTYPVEQRWRPFEESRDHGLNEAIAEAVDELWQKPGTQGDILVFLPGEREIREAADHLRKYLAQSPVLRQTEILPLFARLSQAEQERVFEAHGQRRIVLATNVAETSLTVPGIRYVIDSGTARVKRYTYRSKVEQLLVEPISQAAADQRAGRCGRIANGICIRLYAEDDYTSRPRFTDPEILRSSLAGVILRMKSLRLIADGSPVEDFPFLQAPSSRAIADGFQLLGELGAVDEGGALTPLGRELARLPLDPRLARMIIAGRDGDALTEVLIVASALSVQDVRDRPLEKQAQADQAHAKFDDERSEFSGYLKLWQWLHDARGGQAASSRREMDARYPDVGRRPRGVPRNVAALPVEKRAELAMRMAREMLAPDADRKQPQQAAGKHKAGQPAGAGDGQATRRLSNRQYEQLLRQNLINVRRVREWRDTYTQLRTVATEHGWLKRAQQKSRPRTPAKPAPRTNGGAQPSPQSARQDHRPSAGYEAVHKAMLTGLLGNVGYRLDAESKGKGRPGGAEYLGARGIKFHPHPGARRSKRPGRWIACAELVQTTRLFGRGIAQIDPSWLEEVAGHLLKKQVLNPHWEKKAGEAIAFEQATLYGLPIYAGRRVRYAQVDPREARDILIREALVAGDWPDDWTKAMPFLLANQRLLTEIEKLEHKSRRQDVLVDDALIVAFYDRQLPAQVCDGRSLLRWWRQASRDNPKLLHLSRDELMRHEAAGITTAAFPKMVRLGGVDCKADYLHAPGDARDGVTVTVPLFVLNQVSDERAEWLVPGMLQDKIQALLRSLPQRPRSRLVPLPKTAERLADALGAPEVFGEGGLVDALLGPIREATGLAVQRSDFKLDMMPVHLFMNFRVVNEHGRQLGAGRNLAALKAELGSQARGAFQALAALKVSKQAPKKETSADAAPAPPAAEKAETHRGGASDQTIETALSGDERYTDWRFGEWPELLEVRRKGQTLFGFPALIDAGDAVTVEVFDEPELAQARHRAGLRRLFALQMRDTLRQLEKNIPGLQPMSMAYMPLGSMGDLRKQIIDVAMDRAFMADPLPTSEQAFRQRLQDGRPRLVLIAHEVARTAAAILQEYAAASRSIRDIGKTAPEVARDASEQLQRLMPPRFLAATPWTAIQHFERYLKAIQLRLDKLRRDPERDAQHMASVRSQEQRLQRQLAERKGVSDARLDEVRWMIEELRVSLFAQELRTPRPISVKRLEKIWIQLL